MVSGEVIHNQTASRLQSSSSRLPQSVHRGESLSQIGETKHDPLTNPQLPDDQHDLSIPRASPYPKKVHLKQIFHHQSHFTMDNPEPGSLSWRLSSHPITLISFLGFRLCTNPPNLFPNSQLTPPQQTSSSTSSVSTSQTTTS